MQPTIDTKLGNPNFSGVTTDNSYASGTATVKPPAIEVTNQTSAPLNAPTFNPSKPIPSSVLSSGFTIQDVLGERKRLADELAKSQIASQREQELAQRIKDIETGSTTAQLGLEGQGRGITQDILSKQGAAIQRRETIAKLPLVNELNTLVSQRSSQIDAVKSQLDLTSQNLNILTELQKMTQPDVIGSPTVDKASGNVFVYTRNPQTGQITQSVVGRVSPETTKEYVQTGTYTNSQNQRVLYGVTPDGRIEQQVLGGEQLPASLVPKPGVEGTPLSTTQVNTFNRFAEKLNSSEAIKALDRANNLQNIVAAVKQNPAGASNQLALIYSYIKGLDTDSAVREGEIDLVQSIQPYLRKYQTAFERVTNGKLINEKTALEIANGAETVINSIRSTARNKIASFDEQARRNGTNFYNEWTQYTQSVTPLLMPGAGQSQTGSNQGDPLGIGTSSSNPLGI